jgi:hypothetical protein
MPLDHESKEAISHACCCCCQCACGANYKRVKHLYSGPKDVLNNSWWCCYCLFGGCGLGQLSSPLVVYAGKAICCKNTCESAWCRSNDEDGCAHALQRCCCCTSQIYCPPMPGSPSCVCLGCAPGAGGCLQQVKAAIWDLWWCRLHCCSTDPWWICHCCCAGVGMHEITTGRSLYFSSTKCCICKSTMNSAPPNDRDGCCLLVQLCLWWNWLCQCPPPDMSENPLCACCGYGSKQCRVDAGTGGAPNQQVMGKANSKGSSAYEQRRSYHHDPVATKTCLSHNNLTACNRLGDVLAEK